MKKLAKLQYAKDQKNAKKAGGKPEEKKGGAKEEAKGGDDKSK